MPSVGITEKQKREIRVSNREKSMCRYIRTLMEENHKTQCECAALLGIKQPAFSMLMSRKGFSMANLLLLLDYLEADPDRVAQIMRG